jgi:hypothetical protein
MMEEALIEPLEPDTGLYSCLVTLDSSGENRQVAESLNL